MTLVLQALVTLIPGSRWTTGQVAAADAVMDSVPPSLEAAFDTDAVGRSVTGGAKLPL